jgi:hypothetical protein
MVTRTSSRRAAQKAKEAIATSAEPSGSASQGTKRKAASEKAPQPKKEKIKDIKSEETKPEQKSEEVAPSAMAIGPPTPESVKAPAETDKSIEMPPDEMPLKKSESTEADLNKSEAREDVVPSNILEKGFIYFFFRPRVNIEDPHSIGDIARSFFVLRPTPLGAEFDQAQGSVAKDAQCRLMMLPKKKFPTSGKERDMGFVEKAGQSMQALHDNFIASQTYQTKTMGERHTEEARPYAEGVYAITSTPRASHLAYILTIPAELGVVQEEFGLRERGSWLVQSKNPKYPGPPSGQLPRDPEYPQS